MVVLNSISNTWINNIKKLDEKNKLAHGEIYSRDGSVKDFEINENIVKANVEGAPGDFYEVEIKFNQFTKRNINKLTGFINDNSVIYFKIINGQFPDELLDAGVKILPDSLKDFKMSCSCDKGLFCKHKAAVFHKIAKEIDKNPFLVLRLKGFDLSVLFDNEYFKITTVRELVRNEKKYKLNASDNIDNLTKLYNSLSSYPSFFPSKTIDFKKILYDVLVSMSNNAYNICNPRIKGFKEYITLGNYIQKHDYSNIKEYGEMKKVFEDKWLNPTSWDEFKIDLNGNYEIIKINTGDFDNNFIRQDLKYPLFAFFAELSQIKIDDYSYNIRFLNKLFQFTLKLIIDLELIPEFFRLDNKEFHIRWIPAFEEEIYKKLNEFSSKCPDNLLTFYKTQIPKNNQIIILISLFFEGFSKYFMINPLYETSFINDRYFSLFFIKSQDLTSYNYKRSEIEIDNWLHALYLNQQDYKLVLNVDQKDFEFIFDFKVRLEDNLYDFNEICDLKRLDIVKSCFIIQNIFNSNGLFFDFNKVKIMDLNEYSRFVSDVLPVLSLCGVEVDEPLELKNSLKPKLILNNNSSKPSSSLTLNDLTDFDWKIAIGDETFSIDDFETFAQNYRGLVKIKDKYYFIEDDDLEQLREDISNIPENRDKSSMVSYLLSSAADHLWLDEKVDELMSKILNIEPAEILGNLNCDLRQYQEVGFSWMLQNMQMGFGSILADDMGLGKTVQILTLIVYLKESGKLNEGKVLIVAPTSILTNWQMEVEKFTPSLNIKIYHGMNRQFPEGDYDILLTSYGMIRQDIDEFISRDWFLFVVDEAQNIKNPSTKQTKAIKQINANHHIALSGTPVENHLGEYWSIFDFINKGYLKSLKSFKERFMRPIEKYHDQIALNDFKKITSPFILRRVKTDKSIIDELPDKFVNDIYCNLTVKQASMYDETLDMLLRDVENNEGIKRKG